MTSNIVLLISGSFSTKSLRMSNSSISTMKRDSQESLNSISEGVILRKDSFSSQADRNSIKRRSFGGSLVLRGSKKLTKHEEADEILIERSYTLTNESSFESEDVREENVKHFVKTFDFKDDDTPVPSDSESNEFDEKKRRVSILNQMSLPQVLKDQGMTSLPCKVSFVSCRFIKDFYLFSRTRGTPTDRVGQVLISGLRSLMM